MPPYCILPSLFLPVSVPLFLSQNPITTTAGNRLELLFFFYFSFFSELNSQLLAQQIVSYTVSFVLFVLCLEIRYPYPQKKRKIYERRMRQQYEKLIELTWGPFELCQGEFYCYYGQCVLLGKRIFVCLSESRSQVRLVYLPLPSSSPLSLVTNWFAWAELIFQVKDRAKKCRHGATPLC